MLFFYILCFVVLSSFENFEICYDLFFSFYSFLYLILYLSLCIHFFKRVIIIQAPVNLNQPPPPRPPVHKLQ